MTEGLPKYVEPNKFNTTVAFLDRLWKLGYLPDSPVVANPHSEIAFDLPRIATLPEMLTLADALHPLTCTDQSVLPGQPNDSLDIYTSCCLPQATTRIRWYEKLASCREIWADTQSRPEVPWQLDNNTVFARDERIGVSRPDYFQSVQAALAEYYARMKSLPESHPPTITDIIYKVVRKFSPTADFTNPPTAHPRILCTSPFLNCSLQWITHVSVTPGVHNVGITEAVLQREMNAGTAIRDVGQRIIELVQDGASCRQYAIVELEANHPEGHREAVNLLQQLAKVTQLERRKGRKVIKT